MEIFPRISVVFPENSVPRKKSRTDTSRAQRRLHLLKVTLRKRITSHFSHYPPSADTNPKITRYQPPPNRQRNTLRLIWHKRSQERPEKPLGDQIPTYPLPADVLDLFYNLPESADGHVIFSATLAVACCELSDKTRQLKVRTHQKRYKTMRKYNF